MTRAQPLVPLAAIVLCGLATLGGAVAFHVRPDHAVVPMWLVVGVLAPLVAAALAFAPPPASPRVRLAVVVAGYAAAVALLVVATVVGGVDHRWFVLPLAAVQVVALRRAVGKPLAVAGALATTAAVSGVAWVFSARFAFTSFAEALTGTNVFTMLTPLACGLALIAFALDAAPRDGPRMPLPGWARAATLVAAFWFALRTDGLTGDWVPYHRDFWTATAEFVRQGHLPLWDIPSQYGFLSVVTLAVVPTPTTWQGLYLLTALVLVVQACIVFGLVRDGRRGVIPFVVAALAAGVPMFTAVAWRLPFGPRLYPQGGLRFIWLFVLIAVAAAVVTYPRRAAMLRRFGHVAWALALAWSFECAVWSTLVWGAFITTEALLGAPGTGIAQRIGAAVKRAWPLVVVPPATLAAIALGFSIAIGRLPDWRGFVEFSLAIADDASRPVFYPLGPIWLFPLALAPIAALGIWSVRAGRTRSLPLLVATWFLVWGTASYYVGETFNDHVSLLAGVLALAYGITTSVARSEAAPARLDAACRAAMVPFFVILVTMGSGELPALLRGPFAGPIPFGASAVLPTVPAEIAALERAAEIAPTDPVLFPSSPNWATYGEGLISPFVVGPDGVRHEQLGWFPQNQTGMINQFLDLPPARRAVYRERFLDRSRRGGWLIAYRSEPSCSALSPRLHAERVVRSENYAAALCVFRP